MPNPPKPVVLIIRDGWGRNPHVEHDSFNAVKLAQTPNCDALLHQYPWTLIHTSGEDVGLPDETMGNSEVGHQNIGAGRIVDQESVRITASIHSGQFMKNEALNEAINRAKHSNRQVHLLGIASDAGVHGLISHLEGCLTLCRHLDQPRVAVHLFTDGRDTGPFTGIDFVQQIERACQQIGVGEVASICGRYYAMDRDNRWGRVEKAYACLTGLHGNTLDIPCTATACEAINRYYENPTSQTQRGDEFIEPTMIGPTIDDALGQRISDGDTVIFYNYRGDRPRQITKAFVLDDQSWANVQPSPDNGKRGFNRTRKLRLCYVTMTAYQEGLPVTVAFPKPPKMIDTAGQFLADRGIRQFRCAETEKFPHVTFFFNDYREQPFRGESRNMGQSPKVATYDLRPQMSETEVTQFVLDRLRSNDCEEFLLINYANGDMVGHTGVLEAAVKAIEAVDHGVGQVVDTTLQRGGAAVVTADHGNAEQMWNLDENAPHTAHTTYDVECIIADPHRVIEASGNKDQPSAALRSGGRLADVFPTVLTLMNIKKPNAMSGRSLFDL